MLKGNPILYEKVRAIPRMLTGLLPSPEQKKLVLIAHGRSGSTLFFDLLAQHPDFSRRYDPRDSELLSRISFFPATYLDSCRRIHGGNLWGFHLKIWDSLVSRYGYSGSQITRLLRELETKNYKFVYLKRANLLEVATSIILASKKMRWHLEDGIPDDSHPLQIDPRELLRCLETCKVRQRSEMEFLAHFDHLPISYEHDLKRADQHQNTMDLVAKYLDTTKFTTKARLQKTGSLPLSEQVSNWEEVRNLIGKTDYSCFLDESCEVQN